MKILDIRIEVDDENFEEARNVAADKVTVK